MALKALHYAGEKVDLKKKKIQKELFPNVILPQIFKVTIMLSFETNFCVLILLDMH